MCLLLENASFLGLHLPQSNFPQILDCLDSLTVTLIRCVALVRQNILQAFPELLALVEEPCLFVVLP